MCCPLPLVRLSLSAARIATVAYKPVKMSATATPTFIGSPSGAPVMLMRPPIACTRRS